MNQFPYITDYANEVFARERKHWDFLVVRPLLLVLYFVVRTIAFPIKFVIHRFHFGFENYLIDGFMAFGMKYLARQDAAELFLRHVQIEPLLYRHILTQPGGEYLGEPAAAAKLNGIDGDFNVRDLATVIRNSMTEGHDLLSYEVIDRFDKTAFLDNIDHLRKTKPADHNLLSKGVLEENRRHSWQLLGPTNIVMLVVMTITIFGDFHMTIKALNSFGSDSLLLWCLRHIYRNDPDVLVDLDFFMQDVNNRGHYNTSAFFSNPSQYLYYHIVFDEVAYDLLNRRVPSLDPIK